jgi:hypothetical protein
VSHIFPTDSHVFWGDSHITGQDLRHRASDRVFFLRWSVPPWSVWAAASPFWPTQVGGGRHWLLILVTSEMEDRRYRAPVDRWFMPLFIGFEPSKVLQDFFHPQYLYSYPKHC